MTAPESILEATHVGRSIVVAYTDGPRYPGDVAPRPRYVVTIDGDRFTRDALLGHGTGDGELDTLAARLVKKARKEIDRRIADDSIRPLLESSIGHFGLTPKPDGPMADGWLFEHGRAPSDFRIGEVVVAFGRGCWRRAVVEKTTPTKVVAAYVTSVGGQITRSSATPEKIGVRS